MRKDGVSAIEVAVVLAVISILAAILIPYYITYTRDADRRVCETNRAEVVRYYGYYQDYFGDDAFETYVEKNYGNIKTVCPEGGRIEIANAGSEVVVSCSLHGDGGTATLVPVTDEATALRDAEKLYAAFTIVLKELKEKYPALYVGRTAQITLESGKVMSDSTKNGTEIDISERLRKMVDTSKCGLADCNIYFASDDDGNVLPRAGYVYIKSGDYWAKYSETAHETGSGAGAPGTGPQ